MVMSRVGRNTGGEGHSGETLEGGEEHVVGHVYKKEKAFHVIK